MVPWSLQSKVLVRCGAYSNGYSGFYEDEHLEMDFLRQLISSINKLTALRIGLSAATGLPLHYAKESELGYFAKISADR